MNKIALAVAISLLLSPPLLAETLTATSTSNSKTTTPASTFTGSSLSKIISNIYPDTKQAPAHYIKPDDTDFVFSSMMNATVKNPDKETIGEVKDIVIRHNNLEAIIISVGNYIGTGEHYVAIDPSSVHLNFNNGVWKVTVNATKDSLKAAPEFKYEGNFAK